MALFTKVVLAAAAIIVCIHLAEIAANATRDAIHEWKASRAKDQK